MTNATQTTENSMVLSDYTIPAHRLDDLGAVIAKINRKAEKNGLIPFDLIVGDQIATVHNKGELTEYTTIDYPITIIGDYPSVNGWKCIANIEHTEGVNLISIFGDDDVTKFRERKPVCDHCHQHRIKVQSYIIKNDDTGELMQVGKTCVQDYIQKDPATMFNYLKWIVELKGQFDDDYFGGGSYVPHYGVSEIASRSAMIIRLNGFVSRGKADYGQEPTSELVNFNLAPNFLGWKESAVKNYRDTYILSDKDREISAGMIEYFNADSSTNNFVAMIKDLIKLEFVTTKYTGYIAGAVASYLRHLDKIAADANKTERNNEHIGVIKKRQNFTVTLETVRAMEGYYGTTYIHNFVDDAGHVLVWFASGVTLEDEKGKTFVIKATPKKFDEYKGMAQTVVARVAMQ